MATIRVGFADCGCLRCHHKRTTVTELHPNHGHISDASYCGVCRTAERDRHAMPHGVAR